MRKDAVSSGKTISWRDGWRKARRSARLSPPPQRGLKGEDRATFSHLQLSAVLNVICSSSGENEFVSAKISLTEICHKFNYADTKVRPNLPNTGIRVSVQRLCCHFIFRLKVG